MDLSQPVDRGRSSFSSELSSAFTKALARFVAAGLNFSDKDGPQEATAQSTTLVDDPLMSKSQHSGVLSNISESPDYSRLFFSSPFSVSGESSGPMSAPALHPTADLYDWPTTRHTAQPKLSTLHSGGSDVQSQRISYSGSSNDTPNVSPQKPRLTLAQRFKKEELDLPPVPPTPDADDEAEGEEDQDDAGEDKDELREVLDSDSSHTAEPDAARRQSIASTAMFTAEDGFRSSTDEERSPEVDTVQEQHPGNASNILQTDPEQDLSQTMRQDNIAPAPKGWSRVTTPPPAPQSSANPDDMVAWPSAPIDPPSIEPQEITPRRIQKRAAPPPHLDLAPPAPEARLSSSTPASRQPSPGFPSPTPSPQSTVKGPSPDKPRRRYFTLSFSRKKPPKHLKSDISSPVLVQDSSTPLDAFARTPNEAADLGEQQQQRRYYIDGEEVALQPMDYQDLPDAPAAVMPEQQQPRPAPDGLIPRSGHEWQWHRCEVLAQPSGRSTSWGGFSVDVVGIRESLFSGRSYICTSVCAPLCKLYAIN